MYLNLRFIYNPLLLIAATLMCFACGKKQDTPHYVIAVSQCSQDIWRDKLNEELKMEAYFHDDVELLIESANNDDARQIEQINGFIERGVDLIIVSPNQLATITPAIDRAYDKGIPVIVFDRKTNSKKYTAYIGADNYEIGNVLGRYIAEQLNGKGKVLEIMGLEGSSPAIERHEGFVDAIKNYSDIELVASLQGDWTRESAVKAVKESGLNLDEIDCVFGQNDRMALGARDVIKSSSTIYCGIDALPGADGGIEAVKKRLLNASYIYPTHGDQVLQLALVILKGEHYEKETSLMAAMVTADNANVIEMETNEISHQTEKIEQLRTKANDYMAQIATQQRFTYLAIAAVGMLILLIVLIYIYFLQRARMHEERTAMEREKLDFYTRISHELRTPLTLIEGPLGQLADTGEIKNASPATAQIFNIVRRNAGHLNRLINQLLDMQTGAASSQLSSEEIDRITAAQAIATPTDDTPAIEAPAKDDEMPTILIVDDNEDIRTYLRNILQEHYNILEAEDGAQGFEVAQRQVPDLIVSDVMMPVMSGIEFCQKVKNDMVSSHIPVILLTARAMDEHKIEGYRHGADAYLTKPFMPELLLARISNLLKTRLQLKDLWTSRDLNPDSAPAADAESNAAEATSTGDNSVENQFLARFKAVVNEHLDDSELSVETLAAHMGLSRVQLYRKVKALTGTSPIDLLRRARLNRAASLLKTTELTVSEIAYQVGFSSPGYFTKCYKEEFGTLPGDARKPATP